MEIIKKREEWEGRYSCGHCRAVILVKEEDVEYRVITDSTQFSRGDFYFNCPECQQACSLGEFGPDGLIHLIKQKAIERYEKKKRGLV